jgi:ligand-binding SRPBCC domain-containing protein
MIYRHSFIVPAPVQDVAEFHARSASMGEITPPPVIVKIQRAPECLAEGDEMRFTLWLGPVPVHWLARIEGVSPTGFTDQQVQGPFERWEHRHSFVTVDQNSTRVDDEVTYTIRRHPWWGLVGLGMALGLPALFAYRGWKTKQWLGSHAS